MSFIQFSGKFRTSSNRFCKSGIDFVLTGAPPVDDDGAEEEDVEVEAVDDDVVVVETAVAADELDCCCFDFCDVSFSF